MVTMERPPVTTLNVRYFAWVRERVGMDHEEVALPPHVQTVAALIAHLRERGEPYARAFAKPEVIRVAINQAHATQAASLAGAREVAFFPPVNGG